MASFIEPQEQEEEVVDLFEEQQEEAQEETQEEPQEVNGQQEEQVAEQPEPEDDVPSKYKGKSLKDIVKMHQEAERLIGRQAQEVGEVRKLADQLLQRQINASKVEEATKEDEIDFFEDPKKAVQRAVDKHPAVLQAQQTAVELRKTQALSRLQTEFPDFKEIVTDPEFTQWVSASNVRRKLFAAADAQYDIESAAELLGTWRQLKGTKIKQQETVAKQVTKDERTKAMKAATVDTGTVGLDSKKKYKRQDLIRLQIQDPDRYQAMQEDIMAAYAEGRVI